MRVLALLIANTDKKTAAERGGKAESYEDWTKNQLHEKAASIGID